MVGRIDLLIRSTTTLLSIVRLHTGVRVRYDHHTERHQRHLDLLDRLALLFVTRPNSDVAAVAACLTMDLKIDPDHEDLLLFAKNSKTTKFQDVPHSPPPGTVGTAWVKYYLKQPLDAATHAAQLQFLIAKVMNASKKNTDRSLWITEIYHYVYFQCMPKLQQRLFLRMPQARSKKFYQLFTDDTINMAHLFTGYSPVINQDVVFEKLCKIDETDLVNLIQRECQIKFPTYDYKQGEKTLKHIKLDGEVIVTFFEYLQTTIEMLVNSVKSVMALRQTIYGKDCSKKSIAELTNALASVARSMATFSTLSNHSLTTWILLNQPAVLESFGRAETYAAAEIRHWMRCVSQWDLALRELSRVSLEKHISQPLRIVEIKTSSIPEPKRQASLRETLEALDLTETGDMDVEKAENLLQRLAQKKLKVNNSHKHLLQILANGSGKANAWGHAFSGKMHCESILASLMEMDILDEDKSDRCFVKMVETLKRSSKCIGVSKRCCYTCSFFLKTLNPNIRHTECQGNVYPWAIPTWGVTLEIKKKVLEHLQIKLLEFIKKESTGRISTGQISKDTGSGSEGGDLACADTRQFKKNVNNTYPYHFQRVREKRHAQLLAGTSKFKLGLEINFRGSRRDKKVADK